MNRSILRHPAWTRIRPCFRLEVYGRDGGPVRPRVRIEVHPRGDVTLSELLEVRMPCVACGRAIAPIRARRPPGDKRGSKQHHLYFAAACPLEINVGCSRGAEAREEYSAIRRELEAVEVLL